MLQSGKPFPRWVMIMVTKASAKTCSISSEACLYGRKNWSRSLLLCITAPVSSYRLWPIEFRANSHLVLWSVIIRSHHSARSHVNLVQSTMSKGGFVACLLRMMR